ncbi:uncharacterized protein LOC142085226 [Calonectris borealis]|uniref:uncharacterized protein LOC142085226 n=1 Tax=Calonectris borealis TaxID=1323832 RepID=UPI003F4B1106
MTTADTPTTPKPEDTTPEATEAPMTEADSPTTAKVEDTTLEATEEPITEAESPTTPKPEDTTPEATEAPTTKADSPTTPKPEDTTPEATEAPMTEADYPTTAKVEDTTPEATEEPITEAESPTTPKPEDTTPEATEAPMTEAEYPTTAKVEDMTPEATEEPMTEEDSPTTPSAEEPTPEATEADSPTTPKPEETAPELVTAARTVTITDKKDKTTAKTVTTPVTEEPTTKTETTTVNREITTPKKDKTTVLKDLLTSRKDTTTVTTVKTAKPADSPKGKDDIPNTTPTAKQAVTTTAQSEATTMDKKTATTAAEEEATPAKEDKTPIPKETSIAQREESPVTTATVTTAAAAATTPMPKPTVLTTTAKTDATPKPREIVTTTKGDTTMETKQPVAAAKESPSPICVVVEPTTAGKKEVMTIKETSVTPEKEMDDATEKAPSIDKGEETTVTKETTTREKKDTIEEMFIVSKGTSKPTIHFQEVTDTRDEPRPSDQETLPVKEEPEINNKPLIQTADLPILTGETQAKDEKDLCSGKPADGMVALPNGTLAVFRGHYYWLLNGRSPPTTNPRRISDGWGIPSPIDAVFSRCNCDGKTFFIKGPLYWRFTNGVMDKGYPKPLANGFAGLSGKIVATLPVARYNNRPESVYFIKKDGNMQQYVYRQEPAKKCQRRTHVTVRYPVYVPRLVIRRRFQRAVRMPSVIQTVRINPYPSGVLRKEIKTNTYWRGLPKVIHSTISLPNYNKPDGYDYYAFSYNRYYSLDVGKRIARPVTALTGKTVSKDWYNCPSK